MSLKSCTSGSMRLGSVNPMVCKLELATSILKAELVGP